MPARPGATVWRGLRRVIPWRGRVQDQVHLWLCAMRRAAGVGYFSRRVGRREPLFDSRAHRPPSALTPAVPTDPDRRDRRRPTRAAVPDTSTPPAPRWAAAWRRAPAAVTSHESDHPRRATAHRMRALPLPTPHVDVPMRSRHVRLGGTHTPRHGCSCAQISIGPRLNAITTGCCECWCLCGLQLRCAGRSDTDCARSTRKRRAHEERQPLRN